MNFVGIFGNLFDFDCNGKASFSEELFGISLAAAIAGEFEERKQAQKELIEYLEDEENAQGLRAAFIELESIDAVDYEDESELVIRTKLTELEDKLIDWDCKEPDDVFSAAYDAWEEGREQLENVIFDLESLLDE